MGMCKGCGRVYGVLELKNGYCNNCVPFETTDVEIEEDEENKYVTMRLNELKRDLTDYDEGNNYNDLFPILKLVGIVVFSVMVFCSSVILLLIEVFSAK